jgi:hypothetical protein
MKTPLALLALAFVALAVAPAVAEDGPTPFETALEGLPAPSDEAGFEFEGELVKGTQAIGTVKIAVYPGTLQTGARVWSVDFALDAMGGQVKQTSSAGFDAHCRPLRGKSVDTTPQGSKERWWRQVPDGIRLGQAEDAPFVKHESGFLTSIPSLLLFCRLVGFRAGEWKGDIFDEREEKFVAATWTTTPEGAYGGAKARVVTGKRADGKTLEAGFDIATGELLGVKLGGGGGTYEFRRKQPAKETKEEEAGDVFSRAAKTAQEAAVQAALSFAVADFDLLERVTHWPSIHAQMKDAPEAADKGVDGVRAMMMARFRAQLKPQAPREMVAPMLANLVPTLEAKKAEDGSTFVAFGPMFRNLELTVGAFDGQWYLTRFPSKK